MPQEAFIIRSQIVHIRVEAKRKDTPRGKNYGSNG